MMRLGKHIISVCVLFCSLQSVAQTTITYNPILRSNAQEDTLYDGTIIPVFGITYMLSQPAKLCAKTLYCTLGDSMVLNTKSISQKDHHTIHLHGLDVDTRNDGDPATSFWLKHMQDTTYSFKANNAGTYFYHCHVSDVVHVQMGMYGLIVVKSHNGTNYTAWPGGPIYHSYRNWLLSEVDTFWHNNVPVHDTIVDTMNVPKYNPTHFLINGDGGYQLNTNDSIKVVGSENEVIYLRTGNLGYTVNRIIIPAWLNPETIDSDGRALPSTEYYDTVIVMPGERFGVLLKPLVQGTDTILVEYMDMNTGVIHYTGKVPVYIDGIFGVKENGKDRINLSIYPNPTANGEFTILNNNKSEITRIEIFNSAGALVYSQKINSHSKELFVPFKATSNDSYQVKVIEKSGNQIVKKLIVSK